MNQIPKKQTWQERVVQVHSFHAQQVKLNHRWSIRDSAKALCRSMGAVSQDLQLAEYLRAYSQLGKIESYVIALDWIKEKKRDLRRR